MSAPSAPFSAITCNSFPSTILVITATSVIIVGTIVKRNPVVARIDPVVGSSLYDFARLLPIPITAYSAIINIVIR